MVVFLAILALELFNYQKVVRGVSVSGEALGGLNYLQAQDRIGKLVSELEKQTIEIKYGDSRWALAPEKLGINFDKEKTSQNVFLVGRQKNFYQQIKEQTKSLFKHKNVPLVYQIDDNKISEFAKNNFAPLEELTQNASLIYDPNTDDFAFLPAKEGNVFDFEDFKNQLATAAVSFDNKTIELKKIAEKPVLTQDPGNQARIEAKKIIALAPYMLRYKDNLWPVSKEILLDWLDFVPVNNQNIMGTQISADQIKDFLIELAPSINKEPVNASLAVSDGKVTTFSLSQNGLQLKTEESAQKISHEIISGHQEISLEVDEIPPQISSETIDTLGLVNLIGVGSSNYAGSPKNRVHNISIGAAKMNDILLKPGEEFSFNEHIGEIGAEQGYLPELVIKSGKTVPEYGGGLCQVSTTLFRAAVNSGFKITERYPHAFPVRYYNPQGFDATIYPPHPDLRFLNDTKNNILIQSKIKGTELTFEIYGTNDSREVKIVGPTILKSNPDGSMKTVLYQDIYRDGNLERRDQFWSNYKSPALYPVQRNPLE